ncbi:MAG: glycerophosphodiester phosphodiesterase [Actinobacteria bacterium]|nr:glycerophosphodiester phosphodiesterase [Actinomycetota bacterium]
MPQQPVRHPYLEAPFAALAHRGGFSNGVPRTLENSMPAFHGAWELGYRYLETDVHVTADGVLVAFHDLTLDRVTDTHGAIADLTWAEIATARIGGEEPIRRFEELLTAFPLARFNIDLKAPGTETPLAEMIARHDAWDRVCVGSFSGARLRRFRRIVGDRVATAATPSAVGLFALVPGLRAVWPQAGRVFQVPERDERTGLRIVSAGMLRAAHRRGIAVHVWTVNDRAEMNRLIDLGVDGLVSDDIVTLKEVLIERGLWEGNR